MSHFSGFSAILIARLFCTQKSGCIHKSPPFSPTILALIAVTNGLFYYAFREEILTVTKQFLVRNKILTIGFEYFEV